MYARATAHGVITGLLALAIPAHVALAAPRTFADLAYYIVDLINDGVLLLVGVAMLIFFWNVVGSLWASQKGDAEKQQRLQETLVWGIAILFVMASVWGIITILQQTLLSAT